MKKWIKWIVILVLVAVLVFSAVQIGVKLLGYKQGRDIYGQAADTFATVNPVEENEPASKDQPAASGTVASGDAASNAPAETAATVAPIQVDFDGLRAVNSDVVGWLYCPDTEINYPVLHGDDNDQYLHHSYTGEYLANGSIFVECTNSGDFLDSNTIVYGHSMRDGSMFGNLDAWGSQSYVNDHPVFWLLTPEQDYRVEIVSSYTTSATSSTYTVFRGPSIEFNAYLDQVIGQSVIDPPAQPEEGARYVVFSTCAYSFDDARFVVHGKLVPVNSAGGKQMEK